MLNILDKNKEKKFIDFDKRERIFYDNLYFGEYNIVLKIPILGVENKVSYREIKLEKFDITRYLYLLHYK